MDTGENDAVGQGAVGVIGFSRSGGRMGVESEAIRLRQGFILPAASLSRVHVSAYSYNLYMVYTTTPYGSPGSTGLKEGHQALPLEMVWSDFDRPIECKNNSFSRGEATEAKG
jgi:hypothetical protein